MGDSTALLLRLRQAIELEDLKSAFEFLEISPDLGNSSDMNSLLEIVCTQASSTAEQLKIILSRSSGPVADPNIIFPYHGYRAIHLVSTRGRLELISTLLAHGVNCDLPSQFGETPLHCILLGLEDANCVTSEDVALECVQKIIRTTENIDLNAQDNRGRTVIYLAAKHERIKIADYLMKRCKVNIDIPYGQESPRELLKSKLAVEEYEKQPVPLINFKNTYFELIFKGKEDDLISLLDNNRNIDLSNGTHTLLQAAIIQNLTKTVKKLTEMGADVTLTGADETSPLFLALDRGNQQILKIIISEYDKLGLNENNLLHNESNKRNLNHMAALSENCSASCVQLIWNSILKPKDINSQDAHGNTALHYAAQNNKIDLILLFLENKANIFVRNRVKCPAFLDISPQYIADYLDGHLTTKCTKSGCTCDLVFDYTFMVDKDCSVQSFIPNLLMLARSPHHRIVLKHPIIRSFLHLKWHRISWIFYTNLITYVLFLAFLSTFVYNFVGDLERYTQHQNVSNSSNNESPFQNEPITEITRWLTLLFLIVLTLLKISYFSLQMFTSSWAYLVEGLLYVLAYVLVIFIPDSHLLCATVILLSYTQLMLILSCHPSHATKIAMFVAVCKSFAYLLLWCSSLIVAFAFTFFIIFRRCKECTETLFYQDFGSSFLKTSVMMAGEYDLPDVKLGLSSFISTVIFMCFLFFVATVLMSLLNGLAVSDTQLIKDEAQVVCCEAQVRLHAQLEAQWENHCLSWLPGMSHVSERVLDVPQIEGGLWHYDETSKSCFCWEGRGQSSCFPSCADSKAWRRSQRMLPECGKCCDDFEEILTEVRAVATQRTQQVDNLELMEKMQEILEELKNQKQDRI